MYKILILQDQKNATPSYQYYYETDKQGKRVEYVAETETEVAEKVRELIEEKYSKSALTIIMPIDYDVIVNLAGDTPEPEPTPDPEPEPEPEPDGGE